VEVVILVPCIRFQISSREKPDGVPEAIVGTREDT
jgi:hypothetical protein